MVTKMDVQDSKVDWKKVEKATEIKRTYLVTTKDGRWFFKMYKPSEAPDIFKATGWRGKIVSTVERSKKKEPKSFRIRVRDREINDMTHDDHPRTVKRRPNDRPWWRGSFG